MKMGLPCALLCLLLPITSSCAESIRADHQMLTTLTSAAWREIITSDGYFQGEVANVESVLSPTEDQSESFMSVGVARVSIKVADNLVQEFYAQYQDGSELQAMHALLGQKIGALYSVVNERRYIVSRVSNGTQELFFAYSDASDKEYRNVLEKIIQDADTFCAVGSYQEKKSQHLITELKASKNLRGFIDEAPTWNYQQRMNFAALLCLPDIDANMGFTTSKNGKNPGIFYVAHSLHEFVVMLMTSSFDAGINYDVDRYHSDDAYRHRIDSAVKYSVLNSFGHHN